MSILPLFQTSPSLSRLASMLEAYHAARVVFRLRTSALRNCMLEPAGLPRVGTLVLFFMCSVKRGGYNLALRLISIIQNLKKESITFVDL